MTVNDIAAAIAPDPAATLGSPGALDDGPESWLDASRRRRLLVLGTQILLLTGFLLAWENLAGPKDQSGVLIDEYYVSKPSLIWDALNTWIDRGELWGHIAVTLQTTLYGFVIGTGLGLVGGFVLGVNRFLAAVFQPFVNAIYSIPRLALVPLFVLWFGVGLSSKVALVASVVAFLVFYATFAGVRDVDHELIERMRLMRASGFAVHTKATLPSAMTFIIAGLNVSGPFSLVVAVTAEMMSSNRGLGYLLIRSSGQFHTPGVFAALFVMMLLGMALMSVIRLVERRLLRWKPRAADDVYR